MQLVRRERKCMCDRERRREKRTRLLTLPARVVHVEHSGGERGCHRANGTRSARKFLYAKVYDTKEKEQILLRHALVIQVARQLQRKKA